MAAGAAALLAGCDDSSPPTSAPSATPTPTPTESFDPQDWDSVRSQFLLDPGLAQFAAFVLSPHTAPLQAAIDGYRLELATDTEAALLTGIERERAVRAAAASYAGGRPAEFALTDSTTMGIATMYGGLSLDPGDEVLTTTHDFYSTEASLDLLAKRTGATIRRVSLYDDPATADANQMVARLLDGIGPRTKVVAVTWVHSSTGVRLPIQAMGGAITTVGAHRGDPLLFCVDGVHGFGAVDIDLPDLGCDFLATGTHKWLFGPRGTGILWGRDWSPLTELIPTFSGPGPGAGRLTPGGYQAFEHKWAAADAFGLMEQIGRDRVVARTTEQATQLKEGLDGIPGIRVVTPASPDVSAGIVCVGIDGLMPGNAVYELRQAGVVASATPYADSYLRLGPSIATSPEQVDAAVAAVVDLV
jgi:selenocysteine lyase/cysteine desulfurase